MRNRPFGPYPVTERGDQIDEIFGTKVADPYRWLEGSNKAEDSQRIERWVGQQNQVTRQFLSTSKVRTAIESRMTELLDHKSYGVPFDRGQRRFFMFGQRFTDALYVVDKPGAASRCLLDPSTFAPGDELSGTSVSDDGEWLAYSTSPAGSDWQEWRVRNVTTGEDLAEVLRWSKFSGASWNKDNSGFYYSGFAAQAADGHLNIESTLNQRVHFHKLGTDQSEDSVVFERPDQPDWRFIASTSGNGRYLIIGVWHGLSQANGLFYRDLQRDSPFIELISPDKAWFCFLFNIGSKFWFLTNHDAPMRRIIAVDIKKSTANSLDIAEVVPEGSNYLYTVETAGGRLFLHYLKDACSSIDEYDFDGKFIGKTPLPGIGTVGSFESYKRGQVLFTFETVHRPVTMYRYDLSSRSIAVHFAPDVKFDPSKFVTKQVFYKSKDGSRIPLFISYKKGLKRTGKNPTYLHGYGGFKTAMRPSYSALAITWMEMGGVFASACLRGGGEYGGKWHEAGTKLQKQNVFDDFIAGAEWLIANKYTNSSKLCISGNSNGGLLVAACLVQRPDLFGAALLSVGILDMIRFHLFTVSKSFCGDYGSPENEAEFRALIAYSPVHNIRTGVRYPATLVMARDRDDRVVPAHGYKFAAWLQYAQAGSSPCFLRVQPNAGHGTATLGETVDKLSFAAEMLGIDRVPWTRKQQKTA